MIFLDTNCDTWVLYLSQVISRDVVESQEGQQDVFVLDSHERSDIGNGKLVMESPDSTAPGVNGRNKPAQLALRAHSKRKKQLQHSPTHHSKVMSKAQLPFLLPKVTMPNPTPPLSAYNCFMF